MNALSIKDIIDYVLTNYEGFVVNRNWGERGLFYNPEGRLPKGAYLLTFKEKDGPNDNASNVNRPGIYRLNLGISKGTFTSMFGEVPKRPPAGGIVDTGHDFTVLDSIMPHPVYGWMSWVCVLNPTYERFEALTPLIAEGVDMAKEKYHRRVC